MTIYNPLDWYWLADDGRLYRSASQAITSVSDPDYIAWSATNSASVWPRDESGNQTNAALQDVLTPYNLFVDLIAYTAYARYNRASGGLTITSIHTVPFLTDPMSRNTINSAWNYMAGQSGNQTINWKFSDGSFKALTEAQVTTTANAVAAFVQSCFTCESTTITSINSGSITTQAQVDAAFAAISNVVP